MEIGCKWVYSQVCLPFSAEFLYISAKWCLRCIIVEHYEGWAVTMEIFLRQWSHVEGHKFSFVHHNLDRRQFEMADKCEIRFLEEEFNCYGAVIFLSRWELFALGHQRTLLIRQWIAKMAHLQVQWSLFIDNLLASWSVKTILKGYKLMTTVCYNTVFTSHSLYINHSFCFNFILQKMLLFVYRMRDFALLNSFFIRGR